MLLRYLKSLIYNSVAELRFYISTLCKRDVFGRICLKKRGFIAMKGYNEALVGYGFEDAEFYDGLES